MRQVHPRLRLSVALGRLGVDDSEPLSTKARASIGEHWRHVAELSGQPFDHNTLAQPSLTYNTAPASQALMLVRETYPNLAHPFLGRLGERFFKLGHDIADMKVLSSAAGEFGLNESEVYNALSRQSLLPLMTHEWAQTEKLGVTGYPTLLALGSGKPQVVTIGWISAENVLENLRNL